MLVFKLQRKYKHICMTKQNLLMVKTEDKFNELDTNKHDVKSVMKC